MALYDELTIFSGTAHPALTAAICEHLGIPPGRAEICTFSNENIFVRLLDSVRGNDVFVVQPFAAPLSNAILELLIMIDALKRASAGRITAVVPYYAYARTDKKDQPRVPITARLLADLLTTAGAARLLTLDLHAGQIQGFFNIPVDELTATYLLARHFQDLRLPDLVVVSPDLGNIKRARNYAEVLDVPLAIVERRHTGANDRSEPLGVIGDVAGRTVLLVDDEIDTATTVTQAARLTLERGAREVYVAATHAVLSGQAIDRLRESAIREVVVTDTVPLPPEKHLETITVLSVAPIIGKTIERIHSGTSVSMSYREMDRVSLTS
ncbi:MAG: ribose-phosphate pyrophosphokinase [Chloroflexota bacterium]|nr:ribose-phosphate pyrophosphokinase [Chloroflexota bacterium]